MFQKDHQNIGKHFSNWRVLLEALHFLRLCGLSSIQNETEEEKGKGKFYLIDLGYDSQVGFFSFADKKL